MWGWGKGGGELDSTLAFHQPARKASGNLFRESNVGLSPGQEAPGLLGVVQACPASPRRPKPQFSSTTHLDQKKKKKKISSISKVSSQPQSSLYLSRAPPLQGPN